MIGFSVQPIERRVDPSLVERARSVPVATISDCMSRLSAGGPRLRPLHGSGVLAGPAFTVKTRPGDNLMGHKAMNMAQPGDVIVVDAGGDLTNAIIGGIMSAMAKKRGIAGFVINGAIRDVADIAADSWPVFAAGVTHRGPYRTGPGEIGRPISLDGMVIHPGDLVVGDDDGLLSVPIDEVPEVLSGAEAKRDLEASILKDALEGEGMNTDWVDKTLRELGCSFPDEVEK